MSEGKDFYLIWAGTYEMAAHEATHVLGLQDDQWKYVEGPIDVLGRRNFIIHRGPYPFGYGLNYRKRHAHELAEGYLKLEAQLD